MTQTPSDTVFPPLPWRPAATRLRPRAVQPALDRERIVDAGLAIVDAEGVDALSLRRLAKDLGVTPMAVYWHVRDKAELLDRIGERVLETIEVPPRAIAEGRRTAGEPPADEPAAGGPPSATDWRRRLRDVHMAMLRPLLEHPNAVELMVGRARYSPAGITLFERILSILLEARLSPSAAFDAYQSLYQFQLGFTTMARRSPEFRAAQAEGVGYLRTLDPGAFPSIAAVAPTIGARSLQDQYEIALDIVIDGIAASLVDRGVGDGEPEPSEVDIGG